MLSFGCEPKAREGSARFLRVIDSLGLGTWQQLGGRQMMRVRGVRGATSATGNSREEILEVTRELLKEMLKANEITDFEDLASIIFTTSVQYSVERLSRGSLVVKPIWLLMTMCTVPPV